MSQGEVDHNDLSHSGSVEDARAPLPWSIKLMGIAFALYLLMRVFQGFRWLFRWIAGG